jgi:hypothetical protein
MDNIKEDYKKQNPDERLMDGEGEKNTLCDGDREHLTETYDNLFDSIFKDEDSFDKNIFKVTAGSVAMFFAYVILNGMPVTNEKTMLLAGLFCLVGSLLTNIYSLLAGKNWKMEVANKVLFVLKENVMLKDDVDMELMNLNEKINCVNWVSFVLYFAGLSIISLSVF